MAILRAGPFASSVNSNLDKPSPVVPSIAPVNCALVKWIADDWKYLKFLWIKTKTRTYETGLVDDSESFEATTGYWPRMQVIYEWRYQATSELSMNVTYDISASTTGGNPSESSVEISVAVNGSFVFRDDHSNIDTNQGATSAGLSGSINVTLPAVVVPVFVQIQTKSNSNSSVPGGAGSSAINIS